MLVLQLVEFPEGNCFENASDGPEGLPEIKVNQDIGERDEVSACLRVCGWEGLKRAVESRFSVRVDGKSWEIV